MICIQKGDSEAEQGYAPVHESGYVSEADNKGVHSDNENGHKRQAAFRPVPYAKMKCS